MPGDINIRLRREKKEKKQSEKERQREQERERQRERQGDKQRERELREAPESPCPLAARGSCAGTQLPRPVNALRNRKIISNVMATTKSKKKRKLKHWQPKTQTDCGGNNPEQEGKETGTLATEADT